MTLPLSRAAGGLCALWLVILGAGCASLGGPRAVAVVNGEAVTDQEVQRSLGRIHSAESAAKPPAVDLTAFVQRSVDDKLMLQEARRMGLFERPEVQQGVQAYLVREAIGRLYEEEIERKVEVAEAEVREKFFKEYDEIGVISLSFQESGQAEEAARKLRQGVSPAAVAEGAGLEPPRETFLRRAMAGGEFLALFDLKPGEVADPVSRQKRFIVCQVTSHRPALEEEFAQFRTAIAGPIRKLREKERSDAYVAELAAKCPPEVDEALLAGMPATPEELNGLRGDERVVARVGEATLSVGQVAAGIIQASKLPMGLSVEQARANIVNSWTDERLVDAEALSRHYEQRDPALAAELAAYRHELVLRLYTGQVIASQVKLDEAALKAYYEAHLQDYLKPERLKLRQASFETPEKAAEALEALRKGADFGWLARAESVDEAAQKGGQMGWVEVGKVHEQAQAALGKMEAGQVSEAFHVGKRYEILKLEAREPREPWPLEEVKRQVRADLFRTELERVRAEVAAKLREGARIEIDEGAMANLKQRFFPADAKANKLDTKTPDLVGK